MAKNGSDERMAKRMKKHMVYATKEEMSAFEPPAETKGGNLISWRYWSVANHWVVAVNRTDAVKKAFLAGVLPVEVVEVVKATPASAKAALDALSPEERAKLLKSYK
jgi:hypothetical protein